MVQSSSVQPGTRTSRKPPYIPCVQFHVLLNDCTAFGGEVVSTLMLSLHASVILQGICLYGRTALCHRGVLKEPTCRSEMQLQVIGGLILQRSIIPHHKPIEARACVVPILSYICSIGGPSWQVALQLGTYTHG